MVHRASLHSQACLVGRWRVWGVGEALEGADRTGLRVAIVSPLTRTGYTESLCPPAHLAHFMGAGPIRPGPEPSPRVEEGCPFIHSAANSAKVGSAHVGLVTQRKRAMQRDEEGKTTISLSQEQSV